MEPVVHTTPLIATLLGASCTHNSAKRYGEEIRGLLDRVWPVVKSRAIPNSGINWVVYGAGGYVFAGIEAQAADARSLGLEVFEVRIAQYAEVRHVGPYSRIPESCERLNRAIEARGLKAGWPMIEVYGHWTSDETKLETRIVRAIEVA